MLITETRYMSGGLWSLVIIVKTTATIAVSGEATKRLPDTGCHRSRLWSAAALAMDWDFGPLCFRAARIRGLRMKKIAYLVERMKKQYPDCAVTLSVGEKGTIPINAGLMRVQTAICFAMKQPIHAIMPVSIRLRCLLSTGRNVCIT